jgi:hypothetical protein
MLFLKALSAKASNTKYRIESHTKLPRLSSGVNVILSLCNILVLNKIWRNHLQTAIVLDF